MPLVTLFSAPKAFVDPQTALAQRNAIGSWKRLTAVEVLLMGQEAGLPEAAQEIGVQHLGDVQRNPKGVPLVSSMIQRAREIGTGDSLCIINADIILLSDFAETVQDILLLQQAGKLANGFVVLSRRCDMDVPAPIEFGAGWQERLQAERRERARLHRPTGSDFFLFPRECYASVPDFAIGRAGWDNWMIYEARRQHWAVVDATESMTVIHQNHDYRHLPDARPHYDHPETRLNTRLAGGQAATRYTLLDATHRLIGGQLQKPRFTSARFWRGVELAARRALFFLPENAVESLARPRRWGKRLKRFVGR